MSQVISDLKDIQNILEPWLHQRFLETYGPTALEVELVSLELLKAGQSSDMMRFHVRWQQDEHDRDADFVLRRQPSSNQIFLDPDVLREARVIQGIERHGTAKVAKVLWLEADVDVLGAPFFVMKHVAGFVPLVKPSPHVTGPLPDLSEHQRRHLWQSAMDTLIAIHGLDWRNHHSFLAEEGVEARPLGLRIDALERWYNWAAKGRAYPITDAALAYLKDQCSVHEGGKPSLVWNDARVGNIIFDEDCNVAAALDWEGAFVGPASIDVGYWLMMDEFHTSAIGAERLSGWPSADETLHYYEAQSGRTIGDPNYFIVLAGFFMATTLIRQTDMAVERGELNADSRMAHDNILTQMLARRLGLPIPELSADFAAKRSMASADSSDKPEG